MFSLELKLAETEAALARVRDGLSDMSEVMNEIGEFLAESTQQRIERSLGAPDGTAWAAKSPFTKSKDRRPLYNSGEMTRGIFYRYGADYVQVGSGAIQARTMQFGAAAGAFGATATGRPIPWGDIPARPFIGLSDDDQDGIAEALQEWMGRLASPA